MYFTAWVLLSQQTVIAIDDSAGEEAKKIEAKNVVIATGSKPGSLPFITLDKERVITSTEHWN